MSEIQTASQKEEAVQNDFSRQEKAKRILSCSLCMASEMFFTILLFQYIDITMLPQIIILAVIGSTGLALQSEAMFDLDSDFNEYYLAGINICIVYCVAAILFFVFKTPPG